MITREKESWQKVKDYVDEYIENQVEFFQERFPHTWEENFNDADMSLTKALLADENFIKLMNKYINAVKYEF